MFHVHTEYLENTNRYYNLSTGAYIRYFGEHFHFFLWPQGKTKENAIKDTNNMFLSDGKLRAKSNVCDLGCGIGSLSLLIGSRYHCRITGVNINPHQLEIARQKAQKKGIQVNFMQADIMKLEFINQFDTCFYIDVEPHVPDKRKVIKIINNALKPGGRLVMTAWLQSENPTFSQKEFLLKPYCRLAAFPYMETFQHYRQYFEKEGFTIIKFVDVSKKIKKLIDYYYFLTLQLTDRYNSSVEIVHLVKDKTFIKTFIKSTSQQGLIKTAESIFLGPIYAKLCYDADVFKIGYFVVEKNKP